MGSLIDIRRRIKSTKNTQQITKAMKMVSASRLRRASERATDARPYAERIFDVHRSVLARIQEPSGPLYLKPAGKTLLVVIAGDKGLCGSFNSNITKRAAELVEEYGSDQVCLLPIGKKAVIACSKLGTKVLAPYTDIFRALTSYHGEEISDRLVSSFTGGGYKNVLLLYNKFKNVMTQEVTVREVLPLTAEVAKGKGEPLGTAHLAEPGLMEILDELSPKVVLIQVFQALLESCASEHAARMTAMDAASNNAKEMIEKLTLEMNKARQAAITKELIEVVSGAAAL